MMTNPVAEREIKSILQGLRSTAALCGYLLLLSVAVYVVWPRSEEVAALSSELARKIFVYFACCQVILLVVLAPVFAAGSLTQEKEEGTLELLLASPVPAGRIVRGKLISSASFLLIVLMASLPIVWVILPLGGIAGSEVIGLYVTLALLAAAFAVIGLTSSAHFHRTHSSLVVSYLVLLPLGALVLLIIYGTNASNLDSPLWLGLVALATTILVVKGLLLVRDRALEEVSQPPRPAGEEDTDEQVGLVLRRGHFPDVLLLPEKGATYIGDHENPVYRKEMRSELFGSGTLFARIVVQIALFLSILFIPQIVTGRLEHFFAYLALVMALIAPALCAGAFSQERERDTLDMLLGTLLGPREVVTGKLGCLARYTFILVGLLLVAHVVTYLFSLRLAKTPALLSLDRVGAYMVVLTVTCIACAVVSGFASVLTLRTFSSTILTYVTLLAVYLGPFIVHKLLELFTTLPLSLLAWVTVTSPFGPLLLAPAEGLSAAPPAMWQAYALFWILVGWALVRATLSRYASLARWGTRG